MFFEQKKMFKTEGQKPSERALKRRSEETVAKCLMEKGSVAPLS